MSGYMNDDDYEHHKSLPSHQWHSDTSTESAEAIAPKKRMLNNKVFMELGKAGGFGLTDDEGMVALGMDGNTYRPCRIDLMHSGLVQDAGMRRLTRKNRNAVVWELTLQGSDIYGKIMGYGQPKSD